MYFYNVQVDLHQFWVPLHPTPKATAPRIIAGKDTGKYKTLHSKKENITLEKATAPSMGEGRMK